MPIRTKIKHSFHDMRAKDAQMYSLCLHGARKIKTEGENKLDYWC